MKELAELAAPTPTRRAIRAPWSADAALRQCVRQLRADGEVVVAALGGDAADETGFAFDRNLVKGSTGWTVEHRIDR